MTAVLDVIASAFLVAGGAFVAISALGLVRLPDVYLRMHGVAKAGTLGCGFIFTGVAFAVPEPGVVLRVVGAILFLVVTAPVAAHLIGRAALRTGCPFSSGTVRDERPAGPEFGPGGAMTPDSHPDGKA